MRAWNAIPKAVVEGWRSQQVAHAAGSEFPAHYHEVDEWLQVTTGRFSFTDVVSDETIDVDTGQCLEIPAGSVHRVRVDRDVAYQMWTPMESEAPFSAALERATNLEGNHREDVGGAGVLELRDSPPGEQDRRRR